MRAYRVELNKTSGKSLRTAAEVLKSGGIVAFPTETVYGLCVDPGNAEAVARLYELKGRADHKACAYLIGSRAEAEVLAGGMPPAAERLAHAFWPGPLTLVVPGPQGKTQGIRFSSVALARALVREFGGPLLQTSANRSGEPAALNATGVYRAFPDGVDLVLDAGKTPGGKASTVVECRGATFSVLREGAISAEEIREAGVARIVIACTGNICRSPLGEAMLRRELATRLGRKESELADCAFLVSSCGTQGWEDSPPAPETCRVARDFGYDVESYRGSACSPAMLGAADRVWVMSRHHIEALRPHFQDRPHALELFDPAGEEIEDPFQKSRRVFKRVAKRIAQVAALRAAELVPGAD